MADETFPDPTEAEFAEWLKPPEALAVLSNMSDQTAVSAILGRAEGELVKAAAAVGRWRDGGHHRTIQRMAVPAGWWRRAYLAQEAFRDFWTVGDIVIEMPGARNTTIEFHLFDVRFEPFGIYALINGVAAVAPSASDIESRIAARAPRVAAPTPIATLAAKVEPKELLDWVRQYCGRNPDAPFRLILQNAKLAFPKLRVTERPVRHVIAKLGLTKNRGNPSIKRKIR